MMDSDRRRMVMALTYGTFAWAAVPAEKSSAGEARKKQNAVHVMVLNHHELSAPDFKAQVGDTIRIINKADIAHSIYVTYEDGRIVSLDTQLPGAEKTVTLEAQGIVLLRCWIHPVIRAQLLVDPA